MSQYQMGRYWIGKSGILGFWRIEEGIYSLWALKPKSHDEFG